MKLEEQVCSLKLAKKLRKLAEIIESQDFDEAPKRSNYKAMAKACLDAVCEVIDEFEGVDFKGLKQALRDTLL